MRASRGHPALPAAFLPNDQKTNRHLRLRVHAGLGIGSEFPGVINRIRTDRPVPRLYSRPHSGVQTQAGRCNKQQVEPVKFHIAKAWLCCEG